MHKITQSVLLTLLTSLLVACGANDKSAGNSAQGKQSPKPTLITITQVQNKSIEITEEAIGTLEGLIDPTIAAEVAARVVKVHVSPGQTVKQGQLIATLDATEFGLQRNEAQAEVARIEALLDNQAKTVIRSQALVTKKFISQNVLDNELAQQNVLKEQLTGAKARVSTINHSSSKTKVFAPASGVVEKKIVDTGEFVKVGDPIVQIISNKRLRAHIPFPERISAQLKSGLKIRLSTPTSTQVVDSVVRELKSMITESNRTVDVIADVTDQLDWQAGASVTGTVILGERPNAMMVPEQSVVLRPAGEVVYVVTGNTAHQVIVKTGLRQNGLVEIIDGLNANDTIASNGAGFLTDNAPVKVASDTLTQ
ncbi:MAG: efflux RND transporter periplasmic adaptor subunit [Methylotenera sp.]|nr:efflux RND transporter periplasmic adaptor subunit [Methylotenera sp.]